jgi:hypothetical protein
VCSWSIMVGETGPYIPFKEYDLSNKGQVAMAIGRSRAVWMSRRSGTGVAQGLKHTTLDGYGFGARQTWNEAGVIWKWSTKRKDDYQMNTNCNDNDQREGGLGLR